MNIYIMGFINIEKLYNQLLALSRSEPTRTKSFDDKRLQRIERRLAPLRRIARDRVERLNLAGVPLSSRRFIPGAFNFEPPSSFCPRERGIIIQESAEGPHWIFQFPLPPFVHLPSSLFLFHVGFASKYSASRNKTDRKKGGKKGKREMHISRAMYRVTRKPNSENGTLLSSRGLTALGLGRKVTRGILWPALHKFPGLPRFPFVRSLFRTPSLCFAIPGRECASDKNARGSAH